MKSFRRLISSAIRRWPSRRRALEARICYLENEISRQSTLQRYSAAPALRDLPSTRQTEASFDYQWKNLPTGRHTLENEQFCEEAVDNVCRFTRLAPEWFPTKNVVDVGSGAGRYSWALCKLGAKVLSIDQSVGGLEITQKWCESFPDHRVLQADCLAPFPMDEKFDLVWSFGVIHHTGDGYKAFQNMAQLVKPGGFIFLMVYGEPRRGHIEDYEEINEYTEWRKLTQNLDSARKLAVLRAAMQNRKLRNIGEEYIHGYFDAVSPSINDLYSWQEIEGWLLEQGFGKIQRTVDSRNHHIIAQRE